jgi:hypothetical protein
MLSQVPRRFQGYRRAIQVPPPSRTGRLSSQDRGLSFGLNSSPSGTVHRRPLGLCSRSSRTVADAGERWSALLESVLGATPREFESRILRHADLRKHRWWRLARERLVLAWSHLVVSVMSREWCHHQDQPQLLCLVTDVVNGPEQRGARRRSVRPTVRGRPRPSARSSGRTRADPPICSTTVFSAFNGWGARNWSFGVLGAGCCRCGRVVGSGGRSFTPRLEGDSRRPGFHPQAVIISG